MIFINFKPIAAVAAALLLAVTAGQFAQAQTPEKPTRLVKRDELRTCMNSESSLETRRNALEARRAVNATEVAAVQAMSVKLAEDQKAIDGNDERRVRNFKRLLDAQDERVKAANADAALLRTDLDTLSKALAAYNEQCGGITFLTEDREAILKERAASK